ncbi:hypothetical protein [Palleronia pelagia]|uniref:hypothetical protein n=1 Tax=Palleronia pelagia TaxID=387096 RepID=UPI001114129E|nr:hypothetical protein [Palleronia pelagia]
MRRFWTFVWTVGTGIPGLVGAYEFYYTLPGWLGAFWEQHMSGVPWLPFVSLGLSAIGLFVLIFWNRIFAGKRAADQRTDETPEPNAADSYSHFDQSIKVKKNIGKISPLYDNSRGNQRNGRR